MTSADYQLLQELARSVPLVHDWGRDGWGPFTPITMTAHGAQAFEQTVEDGAGVLTATEPTGGSLRVAYLREGTICADSEIATLVLGPSGWNGTNAQQGHLHRVREIAPGLWEAIAVWTALVGGGYELLNTRAVRFDGAVILQSGGDPATAADSGYIDRTTRVTGVQRFSFGSNFNEYQTTQPEFLGHLVAGDTVTVAGLTDGTFNETGAALNGAISAAGVAQLADPSHSTPVAWTPAVGGTLVPTSEQHRWAPFWMATRVRGGTADALTVEVKRWRPFEAWPAWADPRVQRRTVTSNANVPTVATAPGYGALWGAHFIAGSSGAWGEARFQRA